MNLNTNIDYKNQVFELPELTKIYGEPSTPTLIELRDEIRCNAQSVTTTLGGGMYGHLGLVMSDAAYQLLPDTAPYVRPTYPGPFQVSSDTATEAQIAQERADWTEAMRLWREVEAVERALVQQLVAAVEPKFLKALRNQYTKKITRDVKGILSYLFDNYGKVPPSILKDMKRKVEDFYLDPNDPIDLLFVQIDDLADVYSLQQKDLTETQLIDMAYVTIEKAKCFKKDLREWNRRPANEKTWLNFKKHFRNAQQELRNSGDLTIRDAMSKEELVNVVTESINSVISRDEDEKENANKENEEAINAVTKENNDLKKELENIKKQMEQFKVQYQQPLQPWPNQNQCFNTYQPPPPFHYTSHNNNNNSNSRRNNNRRRNNNYKYVGNGRYCWTHGACDHWGRNCRNKAQGHRDEANFNNTMGGNMNNVRT